MQIMLFSGKFAADFVNIVLTKNNSLALFGKGKKGYAAHSFITSVIAMLFFFISAKGRINVNAAALAYSCVYAVICCMAVILSLVILEYFSVAVKTVAISAGALVLNVLAGVFLFGERPDLKTLIKFVIMISVIALVFLGESGAHITSVQKSGNKRCGIKAVGIILLVILAINGCLSEIILKYYSSDKNVCDNNSFFLFTNAVMCVFSLAAYGYFSLCEKKKEKVGKLSLKSVLLTVGMTVTSNIGSLVSIMLLEITDISLYSPLSSAVGVIAGFAVSLVLREKITLLSCAAAVLSVAAVII